MLGTLVSLLGVAADAGSVHGLVSSVSTGKKINIALERIEKIGASVEQVSKHILLSPNALGLKHVSQATNVSSLNSAVLGQALKPTQNSVESSILSSAPIRLPEPTIKSLEKSPCDFLFDIRPANMPASPKDSSLVPVHFSFQGNSFIGWQTKGAMPGLFGIEVLDELVGSETPVEAQDVPNTIETRVPSAISQDPIKGNPVQPSDSSYNSQVSLTKPVLRSGAFIEIRNKSNLNLLDSLISNHSANKILILDLYSDTQSGNDEFRHLLRFLNLEYQGQISILRISTDQNLGILDGFGIGESSAALLIKDSAVISSFPKFISPRDLANLVDELL